MPNTITPFFAARLVDEKYQVALPLYQVDTATHESLLESVEAITKSSRTPDEIKEMLGVVKAKAADLFAEEEIASLFTDAVESDGTPLTIKIEAEGNYPLIFEALDQLTATVTKSNTETSAETEELQRNLEAAQAKITELEAALAHAVKAEGESTTAMALAQVEIEKLKSEMQEPELTATLKTEIETLKQDQATSTETIETLRKELAGFEALKHDALVKEAARLAIETKRGISKGKSFDELSDILVARTDESLNDTISDCKAELGAAAPVEGAKPAERPEEPLAEAAPVVEKVEDPSLPVADPQDPKPDVEEVADELHATITEEADMIETYMVCGLSEAELVEIYGEDVINKLKEQKQVRRI